jgi:hypothetical protein
LCIRIAGVSVNSNNTAARKNRRLKFDIVNSGRSPRG